MHFGMFMVALLLVAGSLLVLALMNKKWFYQTFLRRHPSVSRSEAVELRKIGADPRKDFSQKYEPMSDEPEDVVIVGPSITLLDDEEQVTEMDAAAQNDLGATTEEQETTEDSHDPTQRSN